MSEEIPILDAFVLGCVLIALSVFVVAAGPIALLMGIGAFVGLAVAATAVGYAAIVAYRAAVRKV